MSENTVKGMKDKVVGNVKETTGKVFNNEELELKGKMQEARGEARETFDDVVDRDLDQRRTDTTLDRETDLGRDRTMGEDNDTDLFGHRTDTTLGSDTRDTTLDTETTIDSEVDDHTTHGIDDPLKVTDDVVEFVDETLDEADEVPLRRETEMDKFKNR